MKCACLALVGLLVVAGCGKPAPDASPDSTQKPTAMKVALLTPGPVSDAGWSAMAYEGLKKIESELGAEVSNQEVAGVQPIRDAMRSYAQKGYRLVFGHGFEYNEPAIQVAKDFPDTVFVSSSGGQIANNVGAFRFNLEQGFYLCGMLAAKLSKTGVIGSVAGPRVPSIASTLKAYEAGARAARPEIKVLETVYTGKDSDIAAARQATLQVIQQGADFVIHQANAGAQGVFDACKEKGVWALGSNLNQNDNPSGVVMASAVIVAGNALVELAKQVQEGSYQGSIALMGMDKGAIDFLINPALADRVPREVAKSLEDAKAAIVSGSLAVPMDEF